MEDISGKGDLLGNVPSSLNSMRALGSLNASLSGRAGAKNSPSFRRLHSARTPRRDFRAGSGTVQWIRGNRVVFWLILITLWAYIGFHVQSRWAHSDHQKKEFVGYKSEDGSVKNQEVAAKSAVSLGSRTAKLDVKEPTIGKDSEDSDSGDSKLSGKGMPRQVKRSSRKRGRRMLKKVTPKAPLVVTENTKDELDDVIIPKRNTFWLESRESERNM